jgi:DNA invertase Pin-like site-specific DNA recombinase
MKKIVLLVRVSTKDQVFEAQKAELIEYAKGHGYSIDEMEIIEDKESATKLTDEERRGLNKMYAAIENPDNKIECVYCWELSRLSRIPVTLQKISIELERRQIDLRTKQHNFKLLDENKEVSTASRMLYALYVSMCRDEITLKVDRLQRDKRNKAKQGLYTGGIILYGYDYDKITKEYQLNEEQAVIIREMFRLYETGKYGLNTLYKEMIKRGHNIKIHQINRILTCTEYIGGYREEYTEVQKRKKQGKDRIIHRYRRYYPPIISKEQFDKCREIAKLNSTRIDKAKNIYFAHSLIRCSCGKHLVAQKLVVQYECHQKYSPLTKIDCNAPDSVNINVMDGVLWTLAKDREAAFVVFDSENQIRELEKQIADVEAKINASGDRYSIEWEKMRKQILKIFKGKGEAEINALTDEAMLDTKREIEVDKTAWENEAVHLRELIDEIEKNRNRVIVPKELSNFEMAMITHGEKITKQQFIERSERFQNKWKRQDYRARFLDTIEDEQEMYGIIHRHVKEVTVKNVADFERPNLMIKKITIQFYMGGNEVLYYYPKMTKKEESVYRMAKDDRGEITKIRLIFDYKKRFERKTKELRIKN